MHTAPCLYSSHDPTTHIVLRILVGTRSQQFTHHLDVALLAGDGEGRKTRLHTSSAKTSSGSHGTHAAAFPPPSP